MCVSVKLIHLLMARYGDTQTHVYVLGKGRFFGHFPNECDDKADRGKSEKKKRTCKKPGREPDTLKVLLPLLSNVKYCHYTCSCTMIFAHDFPKAHKAHRGFKHIFRVRDKRLEQERERKREGNYDGKSSGNKRQGKRGEGKKLKPRRE